MLEIVVCAIEIERGGRDAEGRSNQVRGIWPPARRDVRKMPGSRDELLERVIAEAEPGSFEDRWILASGTCTRRQLDLLGGPSW